MAASPGIRDWAELLPELLGSISQRLTPVEYYRFGVVCTSWTAAASSSGDAPNRPQGMPFLLHLDADGESCVLVNVNGWRPHSIAPIPEMRDKWFVGSQDGWVAILDDYFKVSLLNPITRARIQLPSVTDKIHNGNGFSILPPFRYTVFKKIVVSPKSTAHNYVAVAIFSGCSFPAIATSDQRKWTLLTVTPFVDAIYRDGKFLLLSCGGDLWTLNTSTPSPKITKIPNTTYEREDYLSVGKFLVDSSGDLLQVWRIEAIDDEYVRSTEAFEVAKFDPRQSVWVKLKSLGDRSLFLGASYSICLSVQEFPELKPNCVYFTHMICDWIPETEPHRMQTPRDVGVFNMEDGSLNRYCPLDSRSNWPPPLWFTPSL